MLLEQGKLKKLSYALNRAKARSATEFKGNLTAALRSGTIRLFSSKFSVHESDRCYVFQKDAAGSIMYRQGPETNPSERRALEVARTPKLASDHERVHFGERECFVWIDLQVVEENLSGNLSQFHLMSYRDDDVEGDNFGEESWMDLGVDARSLEYGEALVRGEVIGRASKNLRWVSLRLVSASDPHCLKSDVERMFPHSKEQRSDQTAGRPPSYDEELFYGLLDKKFPGQPQPSLAEVEEALLRFEKSPKNPPHIKTTRAFARRYLKARYGKK